MKTKTVNSSSFLAIDPAPERPGLLPGLLRATAPHLLTALLAGGLGVVGTYYTMSGQVSKNTAEIERLSTSYVPRAEHERNDKALDQEFHNLDERLANMESDIREIRGYLLKTK